MLFCSKSSHNIDRSLTIQIRVKEIHIPVTLLFIIITLVQKKSIAVYE